MKIKSEIFEEILDKNPTLTGRRKILFDTMRKLYPNGKKESQVKFCLELSVDRVEYYIKKVFIKK
jgi:hypothetical protein